MHEYIRADFEERLLNSLAERELWRDKGALLRDVYWEIYIRLAQKNTREIRSKLALAKKITINQMKLLCKPYGFSYEEIIEGRLGHDLRRHK